MISTPPQRFLLSIFPGEGCRGLPVPAQSDRVRFTPPDPKDYSSSSDGDPPPTPSPMLDLGPGGGSGRKEPPSTQSRQPGGAGGSKGGKKAERRRRASAGNRRRLQRKGLKNKTHDPWMWLVPWGRGRSSSCRARSKDPAWPRSPKTSPGAQQLKS